MNATNIKMSRAECAPAVARSAMRRINEASITRRKLSHELGRTEIDRYFNCHSFRSVLISLQAKDGKECLSMFHCRFFGQMHLIYRRALATTP
jgi:hypothetical protein